MNGNPVPEEALETAGGSDRPGIRDAGRDEIDVARSAEYALLASLLLRAPDDGTLERLARMGGGATELGAAHAALADAARAATAGSVEREYFNLFIGVGPSEMLPYASYYLTGFLNERPLARLRGDMQRLGLERTEGRGEPEDHLGTLCEIMSGCAGGLFDVSIADERDFFVTHLAPWASRCFADLEQVAAQGFYGAVGRVGRIFIDIETEAFALEVDRSA